MAWYEIYITLQTTRTDDRRTQHCSISATVSTVGYKRALTRRRTDWQYQCKMSRFEKVGIFFNSSTSADGSAISKACKALEVENFYDLPSVVADGLIFRMSPYTAGCDDLSKHHKTTVSQREHYSICKPILCDLSRSTKTFGQEHQAVANSEGKFLAVLLMTIIFSIKLEGGLNWGGAKPPPSPHPFKPLIRQSD